MGQFSRKQKEADIEAHGTNYDKSQDSLLAGLVTQGASAPSTKPAAKNLLYFATTASKLYVSTGTSNSSDWTEVHAADPA